MLQSSCINPLDKSLKGRSSNVRPGLCRPKACESWVREGNGWEEAPNTFHPDLICANLYTWKQRSPWTSKILWVWMKGPRTRTEKSQANERPFCTEALRSQEDPICLPGFARPSTPTVRGAPARSGHRCQRPFGSRPRTSAPTHLPAGLSSCSPHSAMGIHGENSDHAEVGVLHAACIGSAPDCACCTAAPQGRGRPGPPPTAVKPSSKLPPYGGRVLHVEGCPAVVQGDAHYHVSPVPAGNVERLLSARLLQINTKHAK